MQSLASLVAGRMKPGWSLLQSSMKLIVLKLWLLCRGNLQDLVARILKALTRLLVCFVFPLSSFMVT